MIVPGLQRVIDSLGSFGLSADNDGIITGVVAPSGRLPTLPPPLPASFQVTASI